MPSSDVDATGFMAPIAVDDPLPFRGQAAAPRPAADEIAAEAAALAGATAFVPALSDAHIGPAPSLTLARYASLLVDLERTPHRATVLARYGLDPTAFQTEQSLWAARLSDPATASRLRDAMQQYRAWLDR